MKRRPYPKTCPYCETNFLGDKKNSKYCSNTCRYAWQVRNLSEKSKLRRKEYQKKWGLENWQRKRDYMIKRQFGITPEQYNELLVKQDFRCAICRKHETEFAKKLAIDHDHQTLEIFGLLCNNCNHRFIGKFRDPELFLKAAEYLKQGSGWFVPKNPVRKRKKRKKS